ncbi:hypothetical protein HNQ80_001690 [Anaerosolibacter carboniphilus]|uniref:Copper amine oxidase-like N-terminal domain-containing protein n=1 Tax=Anaerosolibacter carboniphilus TaxID=1417629 RepID=A0A841KQI5_9FIRM|nr:copper amine oxidase N-terminal domain-containing protein [Anaerosolibacter carboniphilus]MBB6215601.1 hypothetical protein [Anaerosolibacter carboniphilus]
MKRKLSLLLAVVMILSLVPMSAFAASDNSVSAVKRVKDDQNLKDVGAPVLRIENDKGDWNTSGQIIDLKLEGACWLGEDDVDHAAAIKAASDKSNGKDVTVTTAVYTESDYRLKLKVDFNYPAGYTEAQKKDALKDFVINVPLWAEMDDAEIAKVSISSKSDELTPETITFATAQSGDTTVTIDDTVTFGATKPIEPVRIEENSIKAIDISKVNAATKYIKLKLDPKFEFVLGASSKISGDLVGGEVEIELGKNASLKDEELKIYFGKDSTGIDAIPLKSLSYAGDIVFSGLSVKPGKDAKEGDVYINVSSDINGIATSKVKLGTYADYKVNVKADGEPTEIFSGRYEVSKTDSTYSEKPVYGDLGSGMSGTSAGSEGITIDEEHELVKLIIDEKVEGSWTKNKSVTVEFPKWVKILGVDADEDDGEEIIAASITENEFEFQISEKKKDGKTINDDKTKVGLTFFVSVEAGKSGDIEAVVGGKALDGEQKVVLGKAVAPVEIKAESAKIQAGVRNQALGKITIKEAVAGGILEDKEIVLELDKDMDWDDEPEVDVVAGDLEIGDVRIDDNMLYIEIDSESTEPSTIEITKGRVKVDRAIAEGKIDVEVKGDALIQNGYDSDIEYKDATVTGSPKISKSTLLEEYGLFNNEYYAKVEVANVITPADNNTKGEPVQFVIDSKTMKVGDVETQMDVAPYIKDGRTMLPVSFVAKAMGVSQNNIIWNEATRTVTIFKGSSIVTITIGSNAMNVNGTPVYMDTVAEIKDGRTMLPISFIGAALGADVTWDAATRTVTVK